MEKNETLHGNLYSNHQSSRLFFENLFSNGLVVFKLIFKLNKREVPTCHRKIIKVVMCVWPSPLPRRVQMRPASLFEAHLHGNKKSSRLFF